MIKFWIVLFLGIIPCSIFALEDSTSILVNHAISAVTLYLNNAEITRTGTVALPAGKSEVVFQGLSARILTQGLHLKASNQVKVYAVNMETQQDILTNSAVFQKSKRELEALNTTSTETQARLDILNQQMDYLEANMKIGGSNGTSFAQIDEGAIYFKENMEALQLQIIAEQTALKGILSQTQELRTQQVKWSKKIKLTNQSIRVTLISEAATSCELELRYLVSNALWKPNYSIRARENSPTIFIEYQAQIYNDTGNDWDNKPISLAILDSSNDISKPTLKAWTFAEKDNAIYIRNFAASRSRSNNQEEAEEDFEVLEVDNLSTRFELNDLHLIPADASPHLIDIITYEKPVTYFTLSIPKIKDGAFLIAQIKDWESLGLINGRAHLYYNGAYQGFSNLNPQQIEDTLSISLGREKAFNLSRKKVSSKSRKNLIGFNIKETISYEILVKNNADEARKIQVKDQIPISTSKDIEVKALETSGGLVNTLNGEVTWDLNLGPNEVKTLNLKLSIKYPKSKRDRINYNIRKFVTPRYF